MKLAKKIVGNLKQARKAKNLTQMQVAKTLSMTQQQYRRFENGVFELNYTQIIELCNTHKRMSKIYLQQKSKSN